MKIKGSACLAISFIALLSVPLAEAQAETMRRLVDDGYSFMDGGKYIRSTETDGTFTEIVSTNDSIPTPCKGVNLPARKTRAARVSGSLNCQGSTRIDEDRNSENFADLKGYNEVIENGDQWEIYKFMRTHSKTTWKKTLNYSTNVNWTWTKRLRGKNGGQCGFDYHRTTCTKKTEVLSRTCTYVPDPEPTSSPGGYNGGSGSGGSGGSGGGYENSNPFGFIQPSDIFDFIIPPAYAGMECTSWSHSRYEYEDFGCYDRTVRECTWDENQAESFQCSTETLPLELHVPPKAESLWNPNEDNYVPFLPNGNDLLPGETEKMSLEVRVSGGQISHGTPNVSGGRDGSQPSFYGYKHEVTLPFFECVQNAQNQKVVWTAESQDRIVSKTPNSIAMSVDPKSTRLEQSQKDFSKTGLFDRNDTNVSQQTSGEVLVNAVPELLKMLDMSSQHLNAITAAFRRNDNRSGTGTLEISDSVKMGESSAGTENRFWKDTFYRVQLVETYPGKSKIREVAELMVQTDSLVKRRENLISLPIAGQQSDTESAYFLKSSGLLIPKGYFKVRGQEYSMIPGQHYELRLSMLHRGIPFYHSGCANNQVSCEREAPNLKAFSEVKAIPFVYRGQDKRGVLTKVYDWYRRQSR